MQRRLKLNLTKLLVIVIAWLVISILTSIHDFLLLSSDMSKGYSGQFSFGTHLLFNISAALIGSLMGGSFLVFYVNEKYRDRSYGFTITAVFLSFIVIVAFITVLFGIIIALMQTGKPFSDPETLQQIKHNIINPIHLKNIIVWSVVVALTQLLLSIDLKFGPSVLWKFIQGKYHSPRQEKRIFMFLDLNSSTSIAEKLGNEKYHQLLKDFFSDITNPVLDNRGEIYQYVGDEAIISWPYEYGIENAQCIRCYIDIRKRVEQNRQKYLDNYGLVPGFKAGIHFGTVIAGEIGVIKRDITFSGDVLNTTSRIQNMCKELQVDMLFSEDLAKQLPAAYTTKSMGANKLRGKEKDIELVTLEPPL